MHKYISCWGLHQRKKNRIKFENKHLPATVCTKGQLNSEWIYEVVVSSKMPTKNLKNFFPGSLLEGKAEILQIFGWHFGRNDDLINSF